MVDTVTKEVRSQIMGRVRSKDTKPELQLRKALFARGLRYRLHSSELPGKPDLVFPRHKAVVFIHGCLWHWHGCNRSRMPNTNAEYWQAKIARNQMRDRANLAALTAIGWRVLTVWECAIKAKSLDAVADEAAAWVRSGRNGVQVIPTHGNGRISLPSL